MLDRFRTAIDAIFIYQFVVYLLIWVWAVALVVTGGFHQNQVVFISAPLIVLVGYVINTRKSALLCAAGDLAMAYSVARYTQTLVDDGVGLDAVLAGALALCMLGRFARDVLVMIRG